MIAVKCGMGKARCFRVSQLWNGELADLNMSDFGMLCYLKVVELKGEKAPNRHDLVERLPLSERTIDSSLADLTRKGLIHDATPKENRRQVKTERTERQRKQREATD